MHALKYFSFIVLFAHSLLSITQSNELHLKLNANYFSIRGSGAQVETISGTPINQPLSPSVSNPYGADGKIRYGAALAFQRNNKANFFFGLAGSIERLTSEIRTSNGIIYNNRIIPGNGRNELHLSYLNLQPYFGLRALQEKARVEFKVLSDFSFLLDSKEEFYFKTQDGEFVFENDREHPDGDIRLGLGMAVFIKKISFNFEYLIGVIDFDDYPADGIYIHSQVIRFGVGYVLFESKSKKEEQHE